VNTFKVRIVRAAKGVYWYSDKVGQVFEVTNHNTLDCRCTGPDINGEPAENFFINKTDCVIVEDERKEIMTEFFEITAAVGRIQSEAFQEGLKMGREENAARIKGLVKALKVAIKVIKEAEAL